MFRERSEGLVQNNAISGAFVAVPCQRIAVFYLSKSPIEFESEKLESTRAMSLLKSHLFHSFKNLFYSDRLHASRRCAFPR